MSKNLSEVINSIMEENSSERVLILTNHLQIIGKIHEIYEECPNCFIALKDVKIARLEELCNQGDCECNLQVFTQFEWFNISVNAIVGFSLLK